MNRQIRNGLPIALVTILGYYLWKALKPLMEIPHLGRTAMHYIDNCVQETGAFNIVSAILFDYRGFDTLGEATAIFTAVTAVGMLFAKGRTRFSSSGLSLIVKVSMGMMIPFIILYGAFIILFGHLSPGGGFQGGAVLATVTILLCIIYGTSFEKTYFAPKVKEIIESSAGLAFIALGIVGAFLGTGFLSNLSAGFPKGTPGEVFSAGFIPFMNILIGLKVGAGLSSIFFHMIKDLESVDLNENRGEEH